ncbi:discoidin domain-containing protein [uncultured Thiodictyon sp.]|uniref:discoidin domain-containing protein n=1 Tax=uncultured Thiodictyon sp. TaxID=1846217 RepID=UPI0025E4886D|nr:discoidin domain-containing protein [uncultured Thiodictyon sp.]
MQVRVLDVLADPAGWLAVAAGEARLTITTESGPQGPALRLDFDFRGGGGFVVARCPLALSLPESYALRLELRAEAPDNVFEVKLADPANVNVWRYREPTGAFTPIRHTLEIKGREFDYAWGPAGGGAPREIGAIEFGIVAGAGGRGTVWLSDLCLVDRTLERPPRLTASSHLAGHPPTAVLDQCADTYWCPAPSATKARLTIDFHELREYGGLALRWAPDAQGCAFAVRASDLGGDDPADDPADWRTLYEATDAAGAASLIYLPGGESRLLRLELSAREDAPLPGLHTLEVLPYDASRTLADWFHTIAQRSPRGHYPRWLGREQTYWTPVDCPDGALSALVNEDGLVELEAGSCSLEPFLYLDGRLLSWADCDITQTLERGELPIPSVCWQCAEATLTTTVFATEQRGERRLFIRYRVKNAGPAARALTLFAAVRPFQVTPPWQAHQTLGGPSPVRALAFADGALWVNGERALVPLGPVSGVGLVPFDQGPITDYLARGELPAGLAITDGVGFASGAVRFDLHLGAGGQAELYLVAPFGAVAPGTLHRRVPQGLSGPAQFQRAVTQWSQVLGRVRFDLPTVAADAGRACKTAIAHILINRDGPALQPGPRRYTRSWIRDGAVMGAALARLGCPAEAVAFIRWYAQFQRADGNVPCCVDRTGVDWLPEHDSHGEFIFAVADCFRFTADLGLVRDLWPQVQLAVGYLEALRAERLTDAYRDGEQRACFGLLPESVSHEGYLAQPVHAYWDDFWALRGLKDAAALAAALGEQAESARLAALAGDFRATLLASLEETMAARGIDYLPGSVEWADQDPTAVANALTVIDEFQALPRAATLRTFERFLERFRAMHGGGAPWTNYTPYEIRIIGALVRLRWRREAHELLDFHLAERRPPAWNQWPEIAWADPRTSGHQGDLPHAWIGAEYALVFRDLFAYEREADQSLVVAAGIPEHWLAAGPVAVAGLPTAYGRLDLRLTATADGGLTLVLGGDLRLPPGGIRCAPPGAEQAYQVLVNGTPGAFDAAAEIAVAALPATVILQPRQTD